MVPRQEGSSVATPSFPELIFGIVAPIGANIDAVCDSLQSALKSVDYTTRVIHITKLMDIFNDPTDTVTVKTTYEKKIKRGNQLRSLYGNAAMAELALLAIKAERDLIKNQSRRLEGPKEYAEEEQVPKTAFIIRQLKHPAEIELLKRIYGQKFVQISATQHDASLVDGLIKKLHRDHPELTVDEVREEAARLIRTDREESDLKTDPGQKVASIFHRADVFIRSDTEKSVRDTTFRFIRALFGDTSVSPTKDEFGTYLAKVAALRSVDLSRQVGAAIMTKAGEVVSVGCNDVPKFGGGIYWTDDTDPHRDVDIGFEGNKAEISQITHNFVNLLIEKKIIGLGKSAQEIIRENPDLISRSMIGEITEYGRMTHAEMSAICDAARLGRPLKDTTIYVTTFPCHNCTKHIIATGVDRVVYVEPYQKSRASKLHSDAIETEGRETNKVVFEPFSGISPNRYREIFEKQKRRNDDGSIKNWNEGEPTPAMVARDSAHVRRELDAIKTSPGVSKLNLTHPSSTPR
jgi:deoxycytidylate deaminase